MIEDHDRMGDFELPSDQEFAMPRLYLFGDLPEGYEVESDDASGTAD